jgi:excisionase family DNA binding protein
MSIHSTGASRRTGERATEDRPLAVSVKNACRLIGVGNTKMWELIKDNKVQTITIGRKRLVVYSSLEALLAP